MKNPMTSLFKYATKLYYGVRSVIDSMLRDFYERNKHLIKSRPKSYTIFAKRKKNYKRNFGRYFTENKDCLYEKYCHLIDGLDSESVDVISIMVSRLMKYYQSGLFGWKGQKFHATESETRMFKVMEDDFYSKLIRFPNGIYAYKKYLLPGTVHSEVFFDKHFIEDLEHLDRLRNRDIIDVGAYIGDSALMLQDYTDKKVYAFDPNPKNIAKINETIKLNNSQKIVPVEMGLAEIAQNSFMRNSVSGKGFTNSGVRVNITTLDEWAGNNEINVGLIKVDIEGFEQKFLMGARETIRKHRPSMLISIYHNASDLFDIKPLIEGMNLGYKFKIRRNCNNKITQDTMLICESL